MRLPKEVVNLIKDRVFKLKDNSIWLTSILEMDEQEYAISKKTREITLKSIKKAKQELEILEKFLLTIGQE